MITKRVALTEPLPAFIEASTLGLAPGVWPDQLILSITPPAGFSGATTMRRLTLAHVACACGGVDHYKHEIASIEYRDQHGALVVLND